MTEWLHMGDTVEDVLRSIERKGRPRTVSPADVEMIVTELPVAAPTRTPEESATRIRSAIAAPATAGGMRARPMRRADDTSRVAMSDTGSDTSADTAESYMRKGAPARGEGSSDLSASIADVLGPLPAEARRVPVIGDFLGDWLESGTSGASGAVHGMTLGHEDDIAGALGGDEAEERVRSTVARDREASPSAFMGGELAGGLTLAAGVAAAAAAAPLAGNAFLGTEAGAVATPGLLARLGWASAEGAAYGAGAAHGESDGEASGYELAEAAAIGGVLGLGGGVVGEGIGELGRMAGRFGDTASRRTIGVIAGAGGSPLSTTTERNLATSFGTDEVADLLVREGIITPTSTSREISDALDAFLERNGREIGEIYNAADARMPGGYEIDPYIEGMANISDDIGADPERLGLRGSVADRAGRWIAAADDPAALSSGMDARVAARRAAEAANPPPPVDLETAATTVRPRPESRRLSGDRVRRALDDARSQVDFHSAERRAPAADVARRTSDALNEAYTNQIDELVPGAAERLRPLRRNYAIGSALEGPVGDSMSREARRAIPGLRATGIGTTVAGATGSTTAGVGAALLADSALSRVPALTAAGARGVRSLLASPGGRAVTQYGPALIEATRRGSTVLSGLVTALRYRDPDFAAATEGMSDEDIDSMIDAIVMGDVDAPPAAEDDGGLDDLGFVPDDLDDLGFIPDEEGTP